MRLTPMLVCCVLLALLASACDDIRPHSPAALTFQNGQLVFSVGCSRLVNEVRLRAFSEGEMEPQAEWLIETGNGERKPVLEIILGEVPEGWIVVESSLDISMADEDEWTLAAKAFGGGTNITATVEPGRGTDGWLFDGSQKGRSWKAYQEWVTSDLELEEHRCRAMRDAPELLNG